MFLSNKLLTIAIAALGVIGVVFAVLDKSTESDDRSALRPSDLEIPERPVLPSISQTGDQLIENIASMNQEIMVLRQNQTQLRERVEELVTMLRDLDEQPGLAPVGLSGTTGIDDTAINAYEPSDDEIAYTRIESYETNLASQHIDSNWSDQVYAEIESMVQNESFIDSSIVSMDCRETLCKLDMTHVSENAMDSFLGEFPHHLAWNNDNFVKTEEHGDGSFRSMIYFSRDGHPLPGADQMQNLF